MRSNNFHWITEKLESPKIHFLRKNKAKKTIEPNSYATNSLFRNSTDQEITVKVAAHEQKKWH